MSRKIWIVLIIASLLAAAIPVSNAESSQSTGEIEPYKGLVGADSPFYGLKLLYQKLDLSFEGNPSKRLNKHLTLARERLAEAYAVALNNNTGALNAALTEYENNLVALNNTLDNGDINDTDYINTSEDIQDQQDILTNMTDNSTSPAVSELFNRTLITAETIKSGRPFIWCNNTSTAYFVPPGQMKKLAQGGQFKTPAGLSKKGYACPEPILVNGTVFWPWDDKYDLYTNQTSVNGTNKSFTYASEASGKHGNGKDKVKSNGNGHGKK